MRLSYGFGANCTVLLFMPIAALLRAYTCWSLWRWFAVPIGAPVIGLAHAYGVINFVAFAASYIPPVKDRDIVEADTTNTRDATTSERRLWLITRMSYATLPALLSLAVGYVAHLLM